MSPEDDKILALFNFQNDLSHRIQKARSNYKKSPKDRITKEYVEARLESVEALWFEFLTGHKDIMRSVKSQDLANSDYMKIKLYDITEEVFLDYKCELKTILSQFVVNSNKNDHSATQSLARGSNGKSSQIKLPKINIPTFSGKYSEWPTFRDLFSSLVHNNEDLDPIQKLHFLKGYLTGEAEQLLRHIPILATSYDRCWKLLGERYNNKKYLCHHILKCLLSQKNIAHESASSLKEMIDTTNDCLSALNNLGVNTESWDILVIHMLSLKLDPESRRQWEFSVTNGTSSDELPTYKQFQDFITNRYRAIEFLDTRSNSATKGQTYSNVGKVYKTLHVANVKCQFCTEDHKLSECKDFAKETVALRRSFVQTGGLCFNCLGSNHSVRLCQVKSRCRFCKGKHHSLIHSEGKVVSAVAVANDKDHDSEDKYSASSFQWQDSGSDSAAPVVSCFSTRKVNQVLLATALVQARSKNGGRNMVRALLDQGSQSSFVTEATVQRLGLKKTPIQGQISGLGGDKNVICNSIVTMEISSRIEPECVFKVKAYVLKSITSFLPVSKVETIEWAELTNLTLADPEYHTPNRIDMLLGAEVYGAIILEGLKKGPEGALVAQSTSLGWILSGVVNSGTESLGNVNVMHCRVDNELFKRFWELESDMELTHDKLLKEDEKRCEEFFKNTTQRDINGKYVVRLPFNMKEPQVCNSSQLAEKRLKSLEAKLRIRPDLKEKYNEVLKEYLELRHMEPVPQLEISNSKAIYLPHHAVVRDDKETSKVRVVYDASMKGTNGKSLNDNLLVGPNLQPDLRDLVMRWRTHPICLTADIVKMYRQVWINPQDIDFQRILWREDPNMDINHYRLLTVTFGTASAPYLAVKTLQQVALDEGNEYPLAAERVRTDFYMDDLLTGCQSKDEGIQIYREMNELLGKGGFELQKWSSNSNEVIQGMKRIRREGMIEEEGIGQDEVKEGLKIKTDEILKIVGLTWNRNDDSFRYSVNLPDLRHPVTKRRILSDISRFYDPIGWAGPSIILSKIMIQKLWLAGLNWDEAVPEQLLNEWLVYREELKILAVMRIPRWMGTANTNARVELHGFCDASKVAYAAVVYIRIVDASGNVHVTLVSAKTKVAPVKQVSIPRLELCGAVMLVRLLKQVAKVLKVQMYDLHAWTDSTVVLAWLSGHPSRWKVFVANRVSEILSNLDSHHWSHVISKENPADAASRGQRPSELVDNKMWLQGPEFLRKKVIVYQNIPDVTTDLEMIKVHCATVESTIWSRFSSLTRMLRVLAYCRRFIDNLKRDVASRRRGYLITQELQDILVHCIRECQTENFEVEIAAIKQKANLPKCSCLRNLNPYLDEDEVLRIGGRLEHAALSHNRKHPIVLPRKSHLTDLIITDAHKQTLHGGPQLMLAYIQSKYWILSAKQLVKLCFRKCVTCVKNSTAVQTQLMGQLPSARVTPTRPFKCSGVDYAGPIQIRTTKGRGYKSYKSYICLFVCMVTRAIHLEVVTDLTSEGFLQAFKRFVARRGYCSDLWSDNATNFVGASSELKRLFLTEKGSMLNEVAESLATNGCEWHFIPARSPNFGGLWEAGVKSVKYHLKRIIGDSTLTYEEMSTVLGQVEACLNSRPQSVLNNDSDGLTVLTPGHFLIGEPLVVPPDRSYEDCNAGSLRRWQYTQKMIQDFWRVWSQEYLTKFYHRYKWSTENPQPAIGDVVVVREDGLPPCRWMYARVIATHPGKDGLVRVVTLQMKNGVVKRPISKLCRLPIAE